MNTISLHPMTEDMCHVFYKDFKNDPAIGHYYEYIYSREKVDAYFSRNTASGRMLFAVMLGDQIIGECKLKDIDPVKQECTMGIHLKDDCLKGKGYGTQAERLMLQYAFECLGMKAVNADVVPSNTRSRHVLEKVGFRYVDRDAEFMYYRCERK